MNVSLYQAASALTATNQWQEAIAANLAAGNLPGFKRNEVSFEAVKAGLMGQPGVAQGAQDKEFTLTNLNTHLDFSPGEMRFTGNPTDLALEGKGFFEVQLPDGSLAYTRDGEFKFNAQGVLTTKEGNVVSSTNGTIQLDLNNPAPISVSRTGEVSQGATPLGQIRVMTANNPNLLTRASAGYFIAQDPNVNLGEAANPAVRQNFLESSNSSATTEMASLMSAMRLFEANQKLIQLHDNRMEKAISTLGNAS